METTRVDGVRRVIEAFTLSQAAPGQRRGARAPPGLVDAVDDARRRGPVRFVVAPEPPPLAPAVLPEVRLRLAQVARAVGVAELALQVGVALRVARSGAARGGASRARCARGQRQERNYRTS